MKKKDLPDLQDSRLRAEPEYQDLCRLLDRQTDAQKARLAQELTQSQGCEPSQDKGADFMGHSTKDLDARIVELKAGELSFSDIAIHLNAEGLTNQAGGKFTRKSVAGRYYRFRGKGSSQPCDHSPAVEHPANDARPCEDTMGMEDGANGATVCEDTSKNEQEPLSSEPSPTCESWEYSLPQEMTEAVRALIREELKAITAEVTTVAKAAKAGLEMPPKIPRAPKSKKFLGAREKLPGTIVDRVLYERFGAERKRLDLSASDLMQLILWNFFNKPRLSFELEPTCEQ